ncbi:VanZ family protein [Yinghuangia seranimata]|uniref:VanZ family protein n=1 Tax=Yinghuangia seranimata TaxID=408067 RepID=UPI00248BECA7|nr:VanZ family protein [Yinghuangia seranimata]MDI2132583.1 VanZ family protein [Yinghuangia seranimata]
MRRVWELWGGVLTGWALVGVPLLCVAAVVLFRLRLRRGVPRPVALRHTVAEVAMLVGTLPWLWMVLTPTSGERAVNLVPLRDLAAVLASDPATVVTQIGANVVLFVPLGFFLPMRAPRLAGGVIRMTLVGAAASTLLETAQYVLDIGRVSSVDDVLVNAAGAGVGALAWRLRTSSASPARPRRRPSGVSAGTRGSSRWS